MFDLNPSQLDTVLRADFSTFAEHCFQELTPGTPFTPSPYIDLMAAKLEAVRTGATKRLIINVPPRSLKSHLGSVTLPAFWLGHDPSAKIICVSYAQELADKLSRDNRALMMAPRYQSLFRTRLCPKRQAVGEFTTIQGGSRLATSINGTLTGRRADVLIIDDPLKPDEALSATRRKAVNDWFSNTLMSRLNNKRDGRIILIMQRLHEDDLTGHLMRQGGWELLRLPAIAEADEEYRFKRRFGPSGIFRRKAGEVLHPARDPLAVIQEVRRTIGEYNFAGQYLQSPAPLDGGLVKRDWLRFYTAQERPERFDLTFQSWDTASKPTELSDFSVCTTWGVKAKNLYLLHVLRKQLDYPSLKRAVREQQSVHNAGTVVIEDKASGTQLIQELVSEGMYAVTAYKPQGDKIMRLSAQTAMIENGFVHLPQEVPWLDGYIHELLTFPKGRYDDQVDSTSQALDWYRQHGIDPGALIYMRSIAKEIERRPGY